MTGAPGSGTSTVARLVARSFERSAHIHTDGIFRWRKTATEVRRLLPDLTLG